MATTKGNLTIDSENIFPIIKKWLYSDHDIFIRELISNGVDAITKLKRLSSMGEADIPSGEEYKVITTIARQHDSAKIFRIVRDIDPNAFVSQSQVRGVFGQGFDLLRDSR